MPRIAGVDIPEQKKIRYSLRYIYGIGPKFADDILAETGIDPEKRARDLTDQEVTSIASIIDSTFIVEGALKPTDSRRTSSDFREIRCLSRSTDIVAGLPVRGQRTKLQRSHPKGYARRTVAGKKGVKG